MNVHDIKVILGDREKNDSNLGYPVYGDVTHLFKSKYGDIFEKVYVLLGYTFEDDIFEKGIDNILDDFEDSLIHEIGYMERKGTGLTFNDVYIKLKGASTFMSISSLYDVIFTTKDRLKGVD